MDEYFGIILFCWIVVAPTVGLVVLGRFDRPIAYRGTSGGARGTTGAEAE